MTTKIKSGVISDNAITSAHISSGAISSSHLTGIDTDAVSEGSSNLYFTTTRARTSLSVTDSGGDGSLTYDNSTGAITYTGPSAAEVRAHISVTDSGGDGSLAYSNGVITYVGPSAAEVRAHLSAGTGVTYSSGEFSIGQSVATTASPTFADINITGDLNLTGDINSYSVTDLDIVDQTITLGVGQSESASDGSGIVIAGSSASILWDEPNDEWDFNKAININGGAEAYNFAATNSITIDNSSGYAAMEMSGSSGAYVDLKSPSSDDYDLRLITFGTGSQILTASGSDLLLASSGNSNQLYLDSSGNVGIGVTPSAWDGTMTALQIDTGSIYANSDGGTFIGANFYYDTTSNTNKYIESNPASAIGLSSGRVEFFVAGSGTAGNDVSFTEAMRVHSNGKVGIGSDVVGNPTMGLHVGNGIGVLFGPSSGASTYISPDHENTINGGYGYDNDTADLWVNYRGYQNGTTRYRSFRVGDGKENLMAIFEGSSGNVAIGLASGTSPAAKLEIKQGSSNWYEGLRINRSDNTTQFGTFSNNSGATFIGAVDTAGGNNNAILFGTSINGTTFNERMRIDSDGNVGIGEQSPGSQLQITSNASGVNAILTIKNAISNRESKLQLIDESNQGGLVLTYDNGGNAAYIGSVISSPLIFNTGNTERMRIDGTDGSVRFKVGAGDSGTNTVNTGSVSMSNTDLDSNTEYTIRSGRYLTSNGTGWETGADGKNPALVIHNDTSQTNNRNWPGIIMHNENNTTDAYGPFIGWGAKSASGVYNTTYAWIMGKPVGNGPDSNWRAGELELYTQDTAYVNTKPALRLTQAGLVQKPRLYDANGFFWARNPNQSNQSGVTAVIFGTRQQAGSGNFSISTGRYTTPVDGVYQFNAQVRIDSADATSSGHYMRMAFYTGTSADTNQSGMSQGHVIHGPGMISGNYFSMSSSWAAYLSAGTQVGVAVLANTGTYDIHGESSFSGFLVG